MTDAKDGTARDDLITLALTARGLSAAPRTHAAYQELIAPASIYTSSAEHTRLREDMTKMSGCGLTVLGLLRLLGVDDDVLYRPYVPGRAIADLCALAKRHGALDVSPTWSQWFTAGQIYLQGPLGGGEHVGVVVGSLGVDIGVITVDGGQRTAGGFQVIRERRRALRRLISPSGAFIRATDAAGAWRPAIAVIDPEKLPRCKPLHTIGDVTAFLPPWPHDGGSVLPHPGPAELAALGET